MAELIGKEDAIRVAARASAYYVAIENQSASVKDVAEATGSVIVALNRIQPIDAIPVVRCKDCKHCLIHDKILFCGYWGSIGEWRYRTETDYCSRGERKDEVLTYTINAGEV